MHRVRLLLHHKVKPILVFDGGCLPAKKQTEAHRYKYSFYYFLYDFFIYFNIRKIMKKIFLFNK